MRSTPKGYRRLFASVTYVDQPYCAAEINAVRVAYGDCSPVEPTEGILSAVIPGGLAHDIELFHDHYFGDAAQPFGGYNCYLGALAMSGRLSIGLPEPNLCGGSGGPLELTEDDLYQTVDPHDTEAGVLLAITTEAYPRRLAHSMVAIDGLRHVAVRGNADRMIIANTQHVMDYYAHKLGSHAILYALKSKPRVVGTDAWREELVAKYPGRPHKSAAKIQKIDGWRRAVRDEIAYESTYQF